MLAEEREDKERTIDNLENALKVERRGTQRIAKELDLQKETNRSLKRSLNI